jgi:high affinity sulfate transporter 1
VAVTARGVADDLEGRLRSDVAAGLSVAAVALPTAIAYAQLAGFPAVVGLYAAIPPLLVYALLGSSRQLIVNPDAATCAMVAAIVAPLATGDDALYVSLALALTMLTGCICVAAGFCRLGFVADFLGRPVLVGFMNGIAISIVLGQIGRVFGLGLEAERVIPRLLEFLSKLPDTHAATLAVGAVTFASLRALHRFAPRLPAPLIALAGAILVVQVLGLDRAGVSVVGHVPAGLPRPAWPAVPWALVEPLLTGALGLALVLVTSGMVTARSFAARNGYEIDTDREMIAIGACNVATGLCQGFAVTGADSRTAVSDSMGGRTQLTGVIAASAIALVLVFFTAPLRYLPGSALGAVLISAGIGLFDWRAIVRLYRIHEGEFLICMTATVGVVSLGALPGIGLATVLSLLVLLLRSARPADAVLGQVTGESGFVDLSEHPGAHAVPGLLIYRFAASVIFYNAAYFKRRVLTVAAASPGITVLVLDGRSIVHLDSTGADTIAALAEDLGTRRIRLCIAGALPQVRQMLERSGTLARLGEDGTFPTLRAAATAHSGGAAPADCGVSS